jgi:hypothetical protein
MCLFQAQGATSRFRMLPLHLAMEGFLALHFNGPEGRLTLGYQYFQFGVISNNRHRKARKRLTDCEERLGHDLSR